MSARFDRLMTLSVPGDVLGNPQRIEDCTPFGLGVPDGGLLDVRRRDPGDALGPLGGELLHMLQEFLGMGGVFGDEGLVHQPFPLNHMRHPQDQRRIGSHPQGKMQIRQLRQLDPPGIRHDELGPPWPTPSSGGWRPRGGLLSCWSRWRRSHRVCPCRPRGWSWPLRLSLPPDRRL